MKEPLQPLAHPDTFHITHRTQQSSNNPQTSEFPVIVRAVVFEININAQPEVATLATLRALLPLDVCSLCTNATQSEHVGFKSSPLFYPKSCGAKVGGQRVVLACVCIARVGQEGEHAAYYLHSWRLAAHLLLSTTERPSAKP